MIGWHDTRYPTDFRTHQRQALAALAEAHAAGSRRSWVVLPPGAGKTAVGLEAARRLARPIIAFGPNTAIQGQWLREWGRFTPAIVAGSTDRDLSSPVTALTYQSLAVFDPDAEVDEDGRGRRLLDRLHPNGLALIEALRDVGPITLILDECHHLVEVWGRLLAEVLDQLPEATVIGLTGTPPASLGPEQVELVRELFGTPLFQTSIPAVVRAGHLAPYTELAWFTPPAAGERDWLAGQAERFAELQTDLLHDHGGELGLLQWLDQRFVTRRLDQEPALDWARLERAEPELTTAALRFHHAGLLALPTGAVVREEHRQPPGARDWVLLLDDYVDGRLERSGDPADERLLAAIRAALPSVGYVLTASGIRRGRSPVDRVIARSEAKNDAAVEILAAEAANLGDGLRALVVTDHERATATLPARLHGVISAQAGSARLLLARLITDPRTAELHPIMITGSTVAAAADTATKIIEYVSEARPDLTLTPELDEDEPITLITGNWRSRDWVALLTRMLETGRTRLLVGTRGLLGEGWDARTLNTLIDLTTATTPTAVVQTRGRALRLDPDWREKVANLWTVVCVSHDHPGGLGDWERFVRKHDGYLGITETGDITLGVSHVDPLLSPYHPPEADRLNMINARMLARSEHRATIRELWRVGDEGADELVHAVWLTGRPRPRTDLVPAHSTSETPQEDVQPPVRVPGPRGPTGPRPPDGSRVPAVVFPVLGAAAVIAFLVVGANLAIGLLIGISLAGVGFLLSWFARRDAAVAAGRRLAELAAGPDPVDLGRAVADALCEAGLVPSGAASVRSTVDPDGTYRILLDDVDERGSAIFATALDEVLSPIAEPRYLIPRRVVAEVGTDRSSLHAAGRAWLDDALITDQVVYHAVPSVLGAKVALAETFGRAWNRWISLGDPVRAATPEGEGIMITHRGRSPFDVTTRLRVSWR
ncbi:DEAD/DEAH box helicase family protein [Microlunatus sp. GCM10028923]|uniref:DEAD/DEAH box helicase family protein n=1 Tax=Microlunatus sp. GCM10028923 TaxID=3273400 RepID=UPI0036089A8C